MRQFISALFLCLLAGGCGSIHEEKQSQARIEEEHTAPVDNPWVVFIEPLNHKTKLKAEIAGPVLRYLSDEIASQLADSGVFLVAENRENAQATLQVSLTELSESGTATATVGLFSVASKSATARLGMSLRQHEDNREWRAEGAGKSSKGAWGVIASVERAGTRENSALALDDTMAGNACKQALRECVKKLAGQLPAASPSL